MKRNSLIIALFITCLLLLSACNDEFLERYPLDAISNETFWNTENDLLVYNNYLYTLAQNDQNVPIMLGHGGNDMSSTASGIFYLDCFSDNLVWKEPQRREFADVRAGKQNPPAEPNPGSYIGMYGWVGWNFVRACNIGLANYDKVGVVQLIKDKYIAEARLFRGWFFADKVSKYGDVPWFDHELQTNSEELYAERTPREEVMVHVLEDLNFASERLPNDWGTGENPGRLNRWCALLVKSRVCLFEGTWRKYHGGTDPEMWLQEAAKAAKELIEKGPYKLYSTGHPDHDYNWYAAVHDSKGTLVSSTFDFTGKDEVMFWRRYKEGIYYHNTMNYFFKTGQSVTRSLVEDYLCTDGLPITLSPLYRGDAKFETIFENRDPRLRQSVLFYSADRFYYRYKGLGTGSTGPAPTGVAGSNSTYTGYATIKGYDREQEAAGWNKQVTPAITLRFGEALLNYAEAVAELGTCTQADLDMSINKLRDRVAMPHLTLNPPMDPRYANDGVSSLIVEIRRERRIELFQEGFRYDDLRRWKQGKKLEIRSMGVRWDDYYKSKYDPTNKCIAATSPDPVTGIPYIDPYKGSDWDNPVFDENRHYLWPIPLSTISQNPNLKQNPGWE